MINIYDYVKKWTPSLSDQHLLAKALSDFNLKVWQRYQAKLQYMYDDSEETWDEDFSKLIPMKLGGLNLMVDPDQIKPQINRYYNTWNDYDQDFILRVEDVYSNSFAMVPLADFISYTSREADSLWIIYQGYNSISLNPSDPAAAFSGFVDKYINEDTDPAIIQAVEGVFSNLVNSVANIGDKVQAISNFNGVNLLLTSTDEAISNSANIPLSDYTGVNPVIGFIGGIDIDFSSLSSFAESSIKAVSNVINTLVKEAYDFFGGVFRTIGSWFTRTFVDPVDTELLSGDTYEFYEITTQVMSPVKFPSVGDPNGVLYSNLFNKLSKSLQESERSITFNTANQWISVSPVTIDGTQYLRGRISIKPLNINAIAEIMSHLKGDNTLRKFLIMMQELQFSDLSLSKGASERDVYIGTLASYVFINYFTQILFSVLNTGINHLIRYQDFESIYDTPLSQLESDVSPDDTWGAMFFNKLNSFMDYMKDITNPSGVEYSSIAKMHNISTPSGTITNNDFLVASTICGNSTVSSGGRTIYNDITAIDNNKPYFGYIRSYDSPADDLNESYPFDKGRVIIGAGVTQFSLLAILISLSESSNSLVTGVYIPYARAYSPTSVVNNIHIKTDQENIDNVRGFFKTTAIIGAVLVASYFGFKIGRRFLQNRSIISAQLLSKKMALGNAYNNSRYTDEYRSRVFSEYNKLRKKARIFYGAVGTVGTGVISKADLFEADVDFSPIIKLIR